MGVGSRLMGMLTSPLALAILATVIFYSIVEGDEWKGSVVARYATGHGTAYVIVGLCFWAAADLLLKTLAFRREWRAFGYHWLPRSVKNSSVQQAGDLANRVAQAPFAKTLLGQRLLDGLHYVAEKESANGLEQHLQYLAQQESDMQQSRYAFVRFVVWLTPILGFLGTVVHFGTALEKFTPEKLETTLSAVTGSMGTAFDTTAAALAVSMTVMLLMFLVERTELTLLHRVERRAADELIHRFAQDDQSLAPFLGAVKQSTDVVMRSMTEMVDRQTHLWSIAIATSLQQADTNQTRLAEWCQNALGHWESAHQRWTAEREKHLENALIQLANERGQQQEQFVAIARETNGLAHRLEDLTRTLTSVLVEEQQIRQLQQTLADNLNALQATQNLDQAVNGLTAAVTLWMARQSGGMPSTRLAG